MHQSLLKNSTCSRSKLDQECIGGLPTSSTSSAEYQQVFEAHCELLFSHSPCKTLSLHLASSPTLDLAATSRFCDTCQKGQFVQYIVCFYKCMPCTLLGSDDQELQVQKIAKDRDWGQSEGEGADRGAAPKSFVASARKEVSLHHSTQPRQSPFLIRLRHGAGGSETLLFKDYSVRNRFQRGTVSTVNPPPEASELGSPTWVSGLHFMQQITFRCEFNSSTIRYQS